MGYALLRHKGRYTTDPDEDLGLPPVFHSHRVLIRLDRVVAVHEDCPQGFEEWSHHCTVMLEDGTEYLLEVSVDVMAGLLVGNGAGLTDLSQ